MIMMDIKKNSVLNAKTQKMKLKKITSYSLKHINACIHFLQVLFIVLSPLFKIMILKFLNLKLQTPGGRYSIQDITIQKQR